MVAEEEGEGVTEDKDAEVKSVDRAFAATEQDLFGDADDLSSSDNDEKEKKDNDEIPEDEIIGPRMYIEDDEQERQAPVETVINVQAPRINADLGNQIHFVKFPNFLSVEPRVFDTETYEDEIDEDEVLDEEGRSRLKLKPTVGDHNHLFVRQGQGLQGQAVFRTKLTFRPHSTDTLTHRKMTLSMADRSSKAQKVKVLAEVGTDPETQKQELVRKEEERLRASARRENQQRRVREKASMSRGLSAGFLEPDRDEESDEGESLAAIKRSYKPGGREFDRTVKGFRGSDSEDSEEGRNRLQGAKRLESDEEKSPGDSSKKKPKVIEDDDDDEG